MATEAQPAVTGHLLTGENYLDSLRDGREVWLNGERVADVTAHPAFRNSARSLARLYDALHDAERQDTLLGQDRLGICTHKFFMPSFSSAELLAARDAIAEWSRLTYGFMGRSPDYKASFMATLGANPDFYEPFGANAARWYERYASQALFLNHVIVNPPVDRNRPVQEVADVFVHVEEERDGGIVVSGAKMLATGSALTHATFVAQNTAANLEEGAEDFALVFIAPMDTAGVKLVSRTSYEQRAVSPFDNPLSSRFDENDAVLIFDRAFIPWEDVLVYRDIARAKSFFAVSGFLNRAMLHGGTRLAVKLDFLCGLFAKGLQANGTSEFRSVKAALGEALAWRNVIWALTSAMALDPQEGPGGSAIPRLEFTSAMQIFSTQAFAKVKELFETFLGGSPIVIPSSHRDLQHPELRPLIDRFYRGTGVTAEERIKLFKLVWDAIGTEFGGRHELYERNYANSWEQQRVDAVMFAQVRGLLPEMHALVEQAMGDYDLDGWTDATWTSAQDRESVA
jgi:4-hydroxyphenylacetate 3-monooxygenase